MRDDVNIMMPEVRWREPLINSKHSSVNKHFNSTIFLCRVDADGVTKILNTETPVKFCHWCRGKNVMSMFTLKMCFQRKSKKYVHFFSRMKLFSQTTGKSKT